VAHPSYESITFHCNYGTDISPAENAFLHKAHGAVGNSELRIIEYMRRVLPYNDPAFVIYHNKPVKDVKRSQKICEMSD